MSAVFTWLVTNWQALVIAILAIDAALVPLFPNAGFLISIKNLLSGLGTKSPPSP